MRPFVPLVLIATLAAAGTPLRQHTQGAPNEGLRAPATPVDRQEEWMGIYFGSMKIGYTQISITPDQYYGKSAVRSFSHSVLRLTVLGASVEQDVTETTIEDVAARPLTQSFSVQSNGSSIHLRAAYNYAAGKVECESDTGGAPAHKTLLIPSGSRIASDTNVLIQGQPIRVGQHITLYYLEPLTIELQPIKIEIVRREMVKDNVSGRSVPAYVARASIAPEQVNETTWESPDGMTLKGEVDMGAIRLTLLKETRSQALDFSPLRNSSGADLHYTPPADFAVATAISTDQSISEPRHLRHLRATIAGVPDRRLLLSDERQKEKVVESGGHPVQYTVDVTVDASAFDPAGSARWPARGAGMVQYLGSGPYLQTDNPDIRATAARLRGRETSLYQIATSVRDWVSRNMVTDASIGVPRSAVDVYRRRRGVCRDYATLYAAIARAAGVPTRLCSGIVYAAGKFFYHAWAESYVGRWAPFDPTLYNAQHPIALVDATHIKFAQGDVTAIFDIVAMVGKLRITVQERG